MMVPLRVEAVEQLAVFQRRAAATFAPKDINVFDQAVPKDDIELLSFWGLIKLNLRQEVLAGGHPVIILKVCWWNCLEIMSKGILKGKEAPLQEVESLDEFALEPEEVREIQETFVMVKVFLQESHHLMDVHRGLYLFELVL